MLALWADNQLHAQTDTLMVFSDEIKIGWFGQKELTFTFEKQDVILFTYKESSKRTLRFIEVFDLRRDKRVGKFESPGDIYDMPFEVPADGDFKFVFKNYGLYKRKGEAIIRRVPKDPIKIYKDSIVVDTVYTTKIRKEEVFDTLANDVLKEELQVTSILNIDDVPRQCIPVGANPSDNVYLAYWIGQGEEVKLAYDELKSDPPIQWLREDIRDPLWAYGVKLADKLPKFDGRETVKFFLTDNANAEQFIQNGPYRYYNNMGAKGYLKPYGTVPMRNFSTISPLMMCFDNQNSVPPVDFFVKVMAFEVITRIEETEIEKIEITESVIKVEVKNKKN
ncbi:MAG: hypothetical protein AAF502_16000 [Bacteroidota bacterium]